MTTETDIPTVFHVEFVEVAEVRTAVGVDEGVAVDVQEAISDTVGYAADEGVGVPGGVDRTTTGLVDEDEVRAGGGEGVEVDGIVDETGEPLAVGSFGNRGSPSSVRDLVIVAES